MAASRGRSTTPPVCSRIRWRSATLTATVCSISSQQTSVVTTSVCYEAMAADDCNQDGKRDLITANSGSDNVSVLLGNGNGTFQDAIPYDTGIHPASVAVGDFEDNGQLDLAVANQKSNTVSVLLGNGDGTF